MRRNWSAKTGSETLVERDGSNSSRNKRHQFVAAKKRYSHMRLFSCYCMVVDDIESIVHCNSKYICVGASLGYIDNKTKFLESGPFGYWILCIILLCCFISSLKKTHHVHVHHVHGVVVDGREEGRLIRVNMNMGGIGDALQFFFKIVFLLIFLWLFWRLCWPDLIFGWLTMLTKDNSSPWLGELRRGKKLISEEGIFAPCHHEEWRLPSSVKIHSDY